MYGISIDRKSAQSATRQICDQLRAMIQSGHLAAGTRLLPTRILAKEWGIARNVVIEVYEQLTAEGYLEGRVGSGTYVAEGLIVSSSSALPASRMNVTPLNDHHSSESQGLIDFTAGIPDQALFPTSAWAKALKAAAESAVPEPAGYGDVRGDLHLRAAIRDYIFRAKGIHCTENQIFIVSGTSEGLSLLAQSLSSRYHSVYLENPTISFTRDIFHMHRYKTVPVQVDHSGMNLDRMGEFRSGHLVLVTPSHQFPTGSLLSIKRRQKAVRMAEAANTFIIEDDYNSEFRLKGIPVPPLHTLSPSRVIYAGTFSKTLTPSLRIGFLIVPSSLTKLVAETKQKLNLFTPLVLQKALSRFIEDGQLERHILAMKKVYKIRRMRLKERLYSVFDQDITVLGDEAGMHLLVQFADLGLTRLPWKATADFGFILETADEYDLVPARSTLSETTGIVLGYGNLSEELIDEGIQRIRMFIHAFDRSKHEEN